MFMDSKGHGMDSLPCSMPEALTGRTGVARGGSMLRGWDDQGLVSHLPGSIQGRTMQDLLLLGLQTEPPCVATRRGLGFSQWGGQAPWESAGG